MDTFILVCVLLVINFIFHVSREILINKKNEYIRELQLSTIEDYDDYMTNKCAMCDVKLENKSIKSEMEKHNISVSYVYEDERTIH